MSADIQREAVEQLIRKKEVQKMVADMPDSTLYYLIKKGDFPGPVSIGARSVAWRLSEIIEWINSRERSISVEGIENEL